MFKLKILHLNILMESPTFFSALYLIQILFEKNEYNNYLIPYPREISKIHDTHSYVHQVKKPKSHQFYKSSWKLWWETEDENQNYLDTSKFN